MKKRMTAFCLAILFSLSACAQDQPRISESGAETEATIEPEITTTEPEITTTEAETTTTEPEITTTEPESAAESAPSELLQMELYVSEQSDLNVLEKCPALRELSLTVFSEISLRPLASLQNLEEIYIYGERASWYVLSDVEVLAKLPLLRRIYLGDFDVSPDLSVFRSLEQLESLSVQGVRSVFFSAAGGFDSLERLSIAETSCDLEKLPAFPRLRELSLIYCGISDEKALEKIKDFDGLERLSLRGSVQENAPELIHTENLTELDLCFAADYTVDQILKCKDLKTLTIREGMFSDEELERLSDALPECEIHAYQTY